MGRGPGRQAGARQRRRGGASGSSLTLAASCTTRRASWTSASRRPRRPRRDARRRMPCSSSAWAWASPSSQVSSERSLLSAHPLDGPASLCLPPSRRADRGSVPGRESAAWSEAHDEREQLARLGVRAPDRTQVPKRLVHVVWRRDARKRECRRITTLRCQSRQRSARGWASSPTPLRTPTPTPAPLRLLRLLLRSYSYSYSYSSAPTPTPTPAPLPLLSVFVLALPPRPSFPPINRHALPHTRR